MTPEEFVEKWRQTELSEIAASHEHFIDICHMLGELTPAYADPEGTNFCFEKAVTVIAPASKGSKGDSGFVDVWKRGCFAWEYKRKGKYNTLNDAYRQLYQYRDALDNPPLSVVCDISTIEIRTHFPGFPTERIILKLEEIPGRLDVLRRLFTHPDSFKPFKTRAAVTADAANEFGQLADRLIDRHTTGRHDPGAQKIAHFLMKLMFCLFAEDTELLPAQTFTRLLKRCLIAPEQFEARAEQLFTLMRTGGEFGNDIIPWFNGGLFDEQPAIALKHGDLMVLQRIAQLDWSGVEPSIFGTLFERILDPDKRAQIGAHYTSREDILLVIQPVIMQPLQRQWAALQEQFAPDLKTYADLPAAKRSKAARKLEARLDAFRENLGKLRVLDSACGSGNFLYVALQQLLELDEQVVIFARRHDLALRSLPWIKPTQMHGIELNPYAAELAQVVIWIGYLQWLKERGLDVPDQPILDKLECIENRDAILDLSDPKHPAPAKWPEADFIVGNPPFLGDKLMRAGLGHAYVESLRKSYDGLPGGIDLCAYWFDLAHGYMKHNPAARAGLLATQNIRGGANRKVLEAICRDGSIFNAHSDREWILEGANVHVSIVCFDCGSETVRVLNGANVETIHANLTAGVDVVQARHLSENDSVSFLGSCKGGPFDIDWHEARQLLADGGNPNGRPNSDVLRSVMNSEDILSRTGPRWIIDNADRDVADASHYAAPHRCVVSRVKPKRDGNRDKWLRENWWRPQRMRPEMRHAITPYERYLVTPTTSKYRIFLWLPERVLPDHQLIVFARADDCFFGLMHASVHELWARSQGTQLREVESGFRYTPTSTFETFPFPWPPGKEDVKHPAYKRISEAAKELNELRERWLNPPEWIEPLAARIDATDQFLDVPAEARPLIRQSAIMALAAKDDRLKKRTLTNLYNERPTWLKLAHEKLDRAVLAAYAATDPAGQWAESLAEVFTDTGPGQPLPPNHPLIAKRGEAEKRILENLLRLNHARAGE